MKFFYVLVILFLMLGVISPIVTTTDAVSDSFLIFQVISAPYDLLPAGEFRGDNYGLAGVWGGFTWHVIDNPDYGEGSTYTALFTGYGFIAIRVGDRYVKQVSVPAYKGGYVGVAYARYSSKTKLDIYLSILSTSYNDLYKVCRIAYTSAYEEYPAIAWLNESIVTVFFYNSSDRDYYVYFTDLNCNIRKAIRVFDGNTYYKYANEVVSANGRDTALFVYRDVGNDLDVYAAIIWGNGSTSILLLSNEEGDEHLGRNAVFWSNANSYLVPIMLSNGDVITAKITLSNLDVELIPLNGKASTPPTALIIEGKVLVYYVDDEDYLYLNIIELNNTVYTYTLRVGDIIRGPFIVNITNSLLVIALTNVTSSYIIKYDISKHEIVSTEEVRLNLDDTNVLGISHSSQGFLILIGGRRGGLRVLMGLLYLTSLDGVPKGASKLYILPTESKALLDIDNRVGLIGLIRSANSSIHAALAFFENVSLARELANAAERGVDVGVVVDDDSLAYEAVNLLISSGVSVYTDKSYEEEVGYDHTMHHKFIIIDGKALIIGTANPTTTGLGSNYENIVVLTNVPLLARALEEEFKDLVNGAYGRSDLRDVFAAQVIIYEEAGDPIIAHVYVGPEHRLDWEVEAVIRAASYKLSMAHYIFTTSSIIKYLRQAIIDKASQVEFKGIFDWLLNEDTPGRFAYELLSNGIKPVFSRGFNKLHAKTFVIDNVLITGSYNPTGSATKYNDESIVLISNERLSNKAHEWISTLHNKWCSPVWRVNYHLLLMSVGILSPQYIAIYNPLDHEVNLTQYLVGDAETVFSNDDEGLFRFPSNAIIQPHEVVIVAYNASEFYDYYGYWPDYEIVDSTPNIPNVELYLPDRFRGNFTFEVYGDEAVLGMISPYDPEFIYIIDMIIYGNSTALPGMVNAPRPSTVYPALQRLGALDSVDMWYTTSLATYIPLNFTSKYGVLKPGEELLLKLPKSNLTVVAEKPSTLLIAYLASLSKPRSIPLRFDYIRSYDVVVKSNASVKIKLSTKFDERLNMTSVKALLLSKDGVWIELPTSVEYPRSKSTLVHVYVPLNYVNSTVVAVGGNVSLVHLVGGSLIGHITFEDYIDFMSKLIGVILVVIILIKVIRRSFL